MENAVEALKIAFAVMMFIMALGLSISSFSQANQAVDAIVKLSDRETEYTYVEPSSSLTRIVGIETVVTTMYKAYEENFEIYFYDQHGNPLLLYYATDNTGERVSKGGNFVEINYIDSDLETYGSLELAKAHLDILLSSKVSEDVYRSRFNAGVCDTISQYQFFKNQFEHNEGLYEYLASFENGFVEQLGEYYQDYSEETDTNTETKNKIKKRVITYTIVP